MTKVTTKTAAVAADIMLFDNWFDPIEDGVRKCVDSAMTPATQSPTRFGRSPQC